MEVIPADFGASGAVVDADLGCSPAALTSGVVGEHRQLRKKGALHSNGDTTNKSGQLDPGVYELGASSKTLAALTVASQLRSGDCANRTRALGASCRLQGRVTGATRVHPYWAGCESSDALRHIRPAYRS